MLALPALFKGLVYDAGLHDGSVGPGQALEFSKSAWNWTDCRAQFGLGAPRRPRQHPRTRARGVMIATVGLERQRGLNQHGDNESIYLLRLLDQVRNVGPRRA